MEKCTYNLYFKNGNSIEFDSLVELDYYLYNNGGLDLDRIQSSVLFKSKEENAIDVIEEMQKVIESKSTKVEVTYDPTLGGMESYSIIDDSVGVSKVITQHAIEGKMLVVPFREKDYFDEKGYSITQQNLVKDGWKLETNCGTTFHKILEYSSRVSNGESVSLEITEEEKKIMGPNWEVIVKELIEEHKNFINQIKKRHGKKCKIYPECQIISKELPEPVLGKNTINGKIDLLVIDESGNAHIYDYKLSKKVPGQWGLTDNKLIKDDEWSSSKKLSIEYQMEMYKRILKQYNITVASVNIVPIQINYNTDEKYGINIPVDVKYFSFGDTISNGITGLRSRSSVIKQIIPSKSIADKIDGLKTIAEPMSLMFPTYDLETKTAVKRARIDYEIKNAHRLKDDDKDRDKGLYWFHDKFKKTDNGRVFCKDVEELERKIAEYVDRINEEAANEWVDISDQLSAISDGSQDFKSLTLQSSKDSENEYVRRIFKKYLDGNTGWKYEPNETLASNGIFVFTNSEGFAEFVVLTNQSINQVVNLGKGTSLLGSVKRDYNVDEHKILKATNGNLNIMKVLCLINENFETFENFRIGNIQVHNTNEERGTFERLDTMFSIFKDATRLHGVKLNITKDKFVSIFEYVEYQTREIIGESKMKSYGLTFSFDINDKLSGIDQLERIRKWLLRDDDVSREINSKNPNFGIPMVELYMYVVEAINRLKGYSVYVEPNPAPWVQTRGSIHAGVNITSAELSPSMNIQTVGNIISRAGVEIKQRTVKTQARYRKVLANLIEYKKSNPILGSGVSIFSNLFRVDGNGNRDSRFLLKHENDPSLSPEESAFIKLFLEIVNEFKYKGDPSRIAEVRNSDTYYEVPITMASDETLRQKLSLKKSIKKSYDEAINFVEIFKTQQNDLERSSSRRVAYNKYSIGPDTRRKLLSENDQDLLEDNLENVLLDVIHTYHKEDVWNSVLPYIQGIKLVLQYKNQFFGQDVSEILDYIDKYIDVNIFSKPVMDSQLQAPYKMLSAIRSFTSATVLGFNVRSGLRELMQGMWNHLSRSMVSMYGKNMFKSSEVLKAWGIIFKLSWKNPNIMSLLDCINAEYGMANVDIEGIKQLLSQTKTGLRNFNSDTLYICNRIPDSYHRLGILIAQMIHDGCWEAHSQDENGELKYDFTKDERFSLLNNPAANKESAEYKSQLSLYLTMAEELRNDGYNIEQYNANKPIPPLPRAYTVREGLSIKSFADLCFGHYDKNTQMMAKHAFLGSFFLQFRTFISAKLEQWILKPGTYNIGKYAEKFDVDGVRIMRVIKYNEDGSPSIEFKREDELTDDDKYATPFKEWQGRFMEGIAYSMFDFGRALIKMDTQELKELWANDTKRANFYLFLNDMVLYSILMAILGSLFFGEEDTEWTPGTHMAAMALYTSFSDGPITQLLSSMGGDLNPPMYSQVKGIWDNSKDVIFGDMPINKYLTKSFGALRDLEYTAKALA